MTPDEFMRLLAGMMESTSFRASDLNFTVGRPAQMEVDGRLLPFDRTPLSAERIDEFVDLIIDDDVSTRRELADAGSCDCAYVLPAIFAFGSTSFPPRVSMRW